jgi:transcriptional regulator with XRE-family HTH domain
LTRRRHVQVGDVNYIGKEADQLEEQLELGSDPEAVIHYEGALEHKIQKLRAELADANLSGLRTASGVSRQSLAAVRDGRRPTKKLARRIIGGLRRLEAADKAREVETDRFLSLAQNMRDRIGLRALASKLRMDHSTLSQVLSGARKPSRECRRRLEALKRK